MPSQPSARAWLKDDGTVAVVVRQSTAAPSCCQQFKDRKSIVVDDDRVLKAMPLHSRCAFDLIELDGKDSRKQPIEERKHKN
jgi:hypothetical protein